MPLVASCLPPTAPEPTGIEHVDTSTADGWTYDYYINHDAPCSESGEQTFVIGTRTTSNSATAAPLWTFLHGGGAGYYSNGQPMPNARNKTEESFEALKAHLMDGLIGRVKEAPENFRLLAVSMCSHDTYAGNNSFDPGNDTAYKGRVGVPTTGLSSTLAAIDFVRLNYATNDVVLHGGSAGSVGTFHVGYWMQVHGDAPTAIIADSAVLNAEWQRAQPAALPDGSPNKCYRSPEEQAGIVGRWDPLFQTPDDQGHRRIELNQLTVPVMHVWDTNDFNQCGGRPMQCPLPDGSVIAMGSAQCNNRPIHDAIEALPASRSSRDFEVCVDKPGAQAPEDCDWHVPTQTDGVNTYAPAGSPDRDYNGVILQWAEQLVNATP